MTPPLGFIQLFLADEKTTFKEDLLQCIRSLNTNGQLECVGDPAGREEKKWKRKKIPGDAIGSILFFDLSLFT